MTERVSALRDRALRSRRGEDRTTPSLWQESYRRTEGLPEVTRWAMATAHGYRTQPVYVQELELLVGTPPGMVYDEDGPVVPQIFGRQPFVCPWPVSDEIQRLFGAGLFSPAGNHTTIDYDAIMVGGFRGLISRVDARLALPQVRADDEQTAFLGALRTIAEGYIDYCGRHADEALAQAAACADPQRAQELRTIAGNCLQVVADPPRTFWQACQSAWFSFVFLPDAPGRVDQYLYPFYRADMDSGRLDDDRARELLSCLWLRYLEFAGAAAAVSAFHHLTLGGMRPDGSDASNQLTWLCLDVTEELRIQRPQVGLRCHADTPPALLERAVRVLRARAGNPDFCNDEQIVPALVRTGISLEDARDFSLSGCHEVIVTGRAQMGSVEGFINLPKVLRAVLGLEPGLLGGATPPFPESWEQLWEQLTSAMRWVAWRAHEAALARDEEAARGAGGHLQASLVVGDCVERGKGYTQGGARYNHCNWNVIGLANLTDALSAIRWLVFDQRQLTLAELAGVVSANWVGHEPLRQRVLGESPNFGNDDDRADAIATDLLRMIAAAFEGLTPFRGGKYILGTLAGGENMHIEFGRMTGATPDGRRDGEPLADSAGPAQGRDRRGVTAMMNSVAKLPHHLLPTATTLNVKLDPRLLETDTGLAKVAGLIRAHFAAGGQQCQFNIVDREMLLEARRDPEQYRDLMVRVAGYSAPFTSLWEDLQDEIIARTEHAL
ncbi:MAG TPA: pyruvate formate lyase family protein [Armatimonadota bacterium]|nr:pyruvate formate lyase family protein [Armatimonadota bacterium]HQK91856.1 pyruvate formate lyase family protein [Armatimonadota bacterium]